MQKEQHTLDYLHSLVSEAFEEASRIVERRAIDQDPEQDWRETRQQLIEQHSIMQYADAPENADLVLMTLVDVGLSNLTEKEAGEYFLQALNTMKTGNKNHANVAANSVLEILSNSFKEYWDFNTPF